MQEKVVLARHKSGEYVVNFEGKKYIWAGAKEHLISRRAVPRDLFDWLSMFTTTFKNGELVVDETNETVEELKENILEIEEYEANALKREDIIKLLEGNFKKMESELKKIKNDTTKMFVLEVAKEIGLDSAAKQRFLKDWIGSKLNIDEIFPVE